MLLIPIEATLGIVSISKITPGRKALAEGPADARDLLARVPLLSAKAEAALAEAVKLAAHGPKAPAFVLLRLRTSPNARPPLAWPPDFDFSHGTTKWRPLKPFGGEQCKCEWNGGDE